MILPDPGAVVRTRPHRWMPAMDNIHMMRVAHFSLPRQPFAQSSPSLVGSRGRSQTRRTLRSRSSPSTAFLLPADQADSVPACPTIRAGGPDEGGAMRGCSNRLAAGRLPQVVPGHAQCCRTAPKRMLQQFVHRSAWNRVLVRDRVGLELRQRMSLHDHKMSVLRFSGPSAGCVPDRGSAPATSP